MPEMGLEVDATGCLGVAMPYRKTRGHVLVRRKVGLRVGRVLGAELGGDVDDGAVKLAEA